MTSTGSIDSGGEGGSVTAGGGVGGTSEWLVPLAASGGGPCGKLSDDSLISMQRLSRLDRRVMRYALLNLLAALSARVEREQTVRYCVIYVVRAVFAKIF
jgi:hypothetical protein